MAEMPSIATPAVDDDPDDAAMEAGRVLFARECRFVIGVAGLDQLPATDMPEVAFVGRSNVGKSSLLNALTGRHALARTSNQPGRTQQLNFFDLDNRLMLVDLPGYGYASAPKAMVERWTRLLRAYLKGRPVLRRCCLLIDARHGIKDVDREMMKMLDTAAVNYQVILTKADKPGADELARRLDGVNVELSRHPAAHPRVLITSARDGMGIPELRAALAALARSVETS